MSISDERPEPWVSTAIAKMMKSKTIDSKQCKELQKEVMQCLDKAISINKHHLFAYQIKGRLLYEMKRWAESIQCYRTAYKLSRDLLTYEGLVLGYLKQNRNLEALKTAQEAVNLFPKVLFTIIIV